MAGRGSGGRFGRSPRGAVEGPGESIGTAERVSERPAGAGNRDLPDDADLGQPVVARDLRDHSTLAPRQSAQTRVEGAEARDTAAHARDTAALSRDRAAELRDREWTQDAKGRSDRRAAFLLRAADTLKRVTADRAAAAQTQAGAAADRKQAARDRELSAEDRLAARADRTALLHELALAETDALTGTRTRAAGLEDLDREIDRARRTTGRLTVAYVDVVGLKAVNDAHGHSAGDALLQRVVDAIRADVRSYDSIVRLGGDEFLCVMSGAGIPDARRRFAAVQSALAADPDPCAIRLGFAALAGEDSAAALIERADAKRPDRRD